MITELERLPLFMACWLDVCATMPFELLLFSDGDVRLPNLCRRKQIPGKFITRKISQPQKPRSRTFLFVANMGWCKPDSASHQLQVLVALHLWLWDHTIHQSSKSTVYDSQWKVLSPPTTKSKTFMRILVKKKTLKHYFNTNNDRVQVLCFVRYKTWHLVENMYH
jgi:hypothetical protein